jgi:hypothetical protein
MSDFRAFVDKYAGRAKVSERIRQSVVRMAKVIATTLVTRRLPMKSLTIESS